MVGSGEAQHNKTWREAGGGDEQGALRVDDEEDLPRGY